MFFDSKEILHPTVRGEPVGKALEKYKRLKVYCRPAAVPTDIQYDVYVRLVYFVTVC